MGQLHDQFERTCGCACKRCTAPCKSFPGFLVPGDMDRIARFMDADTNDGTFWEMWFDASEPVPVTVDGVQFEAGTIVPKQDETGRCVFLNNNDTCMIHPVAPFGCSRFLSCRPDDEAIDRARTALTACATSQDYGMMRGFLKIHGHNAAPLVERRMHLNARLEEI